ncbi:MAG: exodeoxyribonuclease VII small subunit [Cardiobacteriales bacterium]|nr:MAG: exodeoxyribonuclease VII small subunit [Cardiobacteriales bacterium]
MTTDNLIHQYEKHLKNLEDIVRKMESGELSLEASLKQYEEGISLIRQCQQALNDAQQKVQILMQNSNQPSQISLEPFHDQSDDA